MNSEIERNKNKTHSVDDFGAGSQVLECFGGNLHSSAIYIVHVMHTCQTGSAIKKRVQNLIRWIYRRHIRTILCRKRQSKTITSTCFMNI